MLFGSIPLFIPLLCYLLPFITKQSKVNYALGLLRATKAVADGGPVTVSASYNAIAGNMQPVVKAKLTLDGRSVISGEAILLTVPRASLAPKKAVDFLSDKPIEIELEGELLALDGEDAPFYVDRPETV